MPSRPPSTAPGGPRTPARGRPGAVRPTPLDVGVAVLLVLTGCTAAVVGGSAQPLVLAAAAGLALTAATVSRRARGEGDPLHARVPFGRAAAALAAALVVALLAVAVLPATVGGPLAQAAVTLGGAVGSAVAYQGLVHWNRRPTAVSDPGDWLNGVSATVAVLAIGNLVLGRTSSPLSHLPWWQVQGWLLQLSCLLVLVGAAGTVASIAGLRSDTRARAVVAALGGAVAIQLGGVLGLLTHGRPGELAAATTVSWAVVAAGCAAACVLPATADVARPATSAATSAGTLVVLLSSTAILLLNALSDHRAPLESSVLAAAAAVGAGTRVVRLVRDLATLATTRLEARTDDLTGIPNRRHLTEAVDAATTAARSTTLAVIDLDRFKDVNDRFGHAVGDELLRVMARRLVARAGGRATLARLGGDEFAVFLTDADDTTAWRLAEDLLDAVRSPVRIDGHHLHLDASIGIAGSGLSGRAPGELLRCADAAMYTAKRAGGGVRVYDEAADHRARTDHQLVEELRAVLDEGPAAGRGAIVPYYQPQVDMASGRTVGVEALVRWEHPERGLLTPDAFLDLAETHGLMGALTAEVLGASVAEAAAWHAAGHRARVAVNLSTSCLGHANLLHLVDTTLARHALPPGSLVLEITETSLMNDPDLAVAVTRRLTARGVGLSIDDYGTGYSSLAYLNDLPAEELKIDRSFTARLCTDERTAAIVAGTIDLAHHLQLRIVAEGVEDAATLGRLTDLGCDVAQGYLLSRPVPAAGLRAWLAREQVAADR